MSTGTAVLLDSKALCVGVPVTVDRVCRNCYLKERLDAFGLKEDDVESGRADDVFEEVNLLFDHANPPVSICTKCGAGRPKAILPSVLIPVDGVYKVRTFVLGHVSDPEGRHEGWDYDLDEDLFKDVSLYIGHPRKRVLAENLGAKVVSVEHFPGLEKGECALVLSVKKERADRLLARKPEVLSGCGGVDAFPALTLDDMVLRIIKRLE